jgi:hypothetical protein
MRVTSTSGNSGMSAAAKAKLRLSSVHEKISVLDIVLIVGRIDCCMGPNHLRTQRYPKPPASGPDGRSLLRGFAG